MSSLAVAQPATSLRPNSAYPRLSEPIPLSAPDVSEDDRQRVMDVLIGRNLSLGPLLPAFEESMADAAGTRFAVAVNSGTSALHLCVKAAGIGENDEVITTPFSFVASANCMLYERAVPRFADIDINTYNIDPAAAAAAVTSRTRGILPVHVFGHPCDMPAINDIARRHGLAVIEDACEAIGATIEGRRAGSFGDSGAFAFYPNKQITTGEGGAIVTNDEQTARLCRSWRNQGRGEGGAWLQHERLGYNYRLSDINCALGLGQLSRLTTILAARKRVAETYNHILSRVPGVILPPYCGPGVPGPYDVSPDVGARHASPASAVKTCCQSTSPSTEMSWFVYVIRLEDEFTREDRDLVLESLRREGIGCNNYFAPIHLQQFYRDQFHYRKGDFPVTEHVADRTIALPFFNHLTEGQANAVASALQRALNQVDRATLTIPVQSARS